MRYNFPWLGLLLLVSLLQACYEPTEGCLDTRATNFDLDADEACADCCTYPQLSLRFNNVWDYGDTVVALRFDTFYVDAANNPFRLERIRFYWSDFRLQLNDGSELNITDSLAVAIAENGDTSTITIRDDIMLADINRASRTVSLGNLVPEGTLTGLQATFGMEDPVNKTVVTSVSTSHPLAQQERLMNFGTEFGYVFAKVEYFQDTIATDTILRAINIYGSDFIRELDLELLVPTSFVDGFDPTLVIEQDISRWFDGINVRLADTTALKISLSKNLTQSLQITELLAQ